MKYPGTPIPLGLRAWFLVEVFFGVGAVLSIGLAPENTRNNFAWDVQPVVMASVLGAYYMSSALLFVLPLFARRWEMIRVMILPTAIFSTAELIATFLHWDKFLLGTPSFWGWLISYALPPPIFFGFYFYLQRKVKKSGVVVPYEPLAPDVRTALLQVGGLLAIIAVVIYIFPNLLVDVAPWRMTPLTTRAFVSWLIALAALMLSMARENDRTRVLVGVPMLLLVLPAVTLQIARFPGQVNFQNPALFILYGFTLVAFVLGVYLARGDWRRALELMFKLHKYLAYGWLENLDTVRHLPIGTFWGIPTSITPTIWLFVPVFFALGVLQNRGGSNDNNKVLYLAFVYLTGVSITTLFHQFGHILGGKLVVSPMDELLLTATRGVNIYRGDQTLVPGYVHLCRSLGGPVFNLVVAGVLYSLLPFVGRGFLFDVLLVLASTNLFFGIGSFAPLPSIDGWVIWREVLALLRARFAERSA